MRFQSFSPRQNATLLWWTKPEYKDFDGIICDGSIRSGKTVSMSVGFVLWSMASFNNQSFAICGRTIESLRRNVIVHLPTLLEGLFTVVERRAENKLIISVGKRTNTYYLFGGRDESSYTLVQGITLAGVLFDEVALMPRSFVEQTMARCSAAGSKFWFNCNPEGPSHWFYQEWVLRARDRNILHLHFTMRDNLSLSDRIRERYEGMYTGVFYARYIKGLWTKAEGLVYPFFDPTKHLVADKGGSGRYFVSCDYGTINPCVFGLWRLNGSSATMVKEYYFDSRKRQRQKTDEEYYEDLEAFIGRTPIEQIIIDPSAASFKETIRRHGKYSVKDARNAVLDGIRLTSTLLQAGLLKFDKSCVFTQAEFGAYAWDEKATVDAVIKENDHSMDQMRYFVQTVMRREVRANGI